jgi:ParB family chromosome partitioning protein
VEPSSEKRRSLGRGLSALIPPRPEPSQPVAVSAATVGAAAQLPIEEILPGDSQPRQRFDDARLDELASSIKAHGVIQPIVVRRRGPDRYEIIAGERRWRAAQKAGLKTIPAVVSDAAPEDTLTLALVENLQREDLNPIEEAEAFHRLHEGLGYSQQEIAEAVGKDRTTVSNALRLLKLPQPVRQQVLDGELSMGHARALLSLEDTEEMERLGKEVAMRGWSVRQTEKATQPATSNRRKSPGKESEAERDVRQRLQRALATRVDLKHKQGKGTLVVHFSNYAELDALLARFGA